jgi:hydroxypyruvate reductase
LGERLSGGIVAVKEGHGCPLAKLRLIEAGHPLPDERSLAAARAILGLGESLDTALTERDIVVVLVSGGGSAILCAPAEGLSLADKAAATKLLLSSGATINEVNCLRKHLSAVKGGRLAAALAPASVLTLVLSDVVGDDLDAIASGPTVPDPTSFSDALSIAQRYGIEAALPPAVRKRLAEGAAGAIADTPKPGDPAFARTRTILVGTNRLALEAAAEEAGRRRYKSLVLSSRVTGEARETALFYLGIGKDIEASGFPLGRPACIIAGGETTVTLRGKGVGGRNQEMALAFLAALRRSPKDGEGLLFLSAGTDGNDGPTDAAGAFASLELAREGEARGLDPEAALADNDSYPFFESLGALLKTGPTGTNVCDIQILIAV